MAIARPTIGVLKDDEIHPQAYSAMAYVRNFLVNHKNILLLQESLHSCALEGNYSAEICGETLRRVIGAEPVGDRYILGLAWFLHSLER